MALGAVAGAEQLDDGSQREPQVERDRLRQMAAGDGAVDQPLRRRVDADGSGRRSPPSPRRRLGLVVVALDDQQPVGVEADQRRAVATYVEVPVLIGRLPDHDVDEPGRGGQVARRGVERRRSTGGRRRTSSRAAPTRWSARSVSTIPPTGVCRRVEVPRRGQRLDVEVGVLVVPTRGRGPADPRAAQVGVGGALLVEPGEEVGIAGEVGLVAHAPSIRQPLVEEGAPAPVTRPGDRSVVRCRGLVTLAARAPRPAEPVRCRVS